MRLRIAGITTLGVVGAAAVAFAAGHLRRQDGVVEPRWWGLSVVARTHDGRVVATVSTLAGFAVLAIASLLLLAARPSVRAALAVVALWAVPFLVAPPVASLDVYSYAAQGDLLERGLDPSHVGVGRAGPAFAAAADPRWYDAHAPYGPLALLVSHGATAAGGRHVLASVVALRIVAVAALLVTVAIAVRVATDPLLAVVVAAGPLVLITFASAAHHEALMTALAVAALAAQRRGRPFLAALLAAAAAAVKLPGVVVLGAVVCGELAEASALRERTAVLVRAAIATVLVWGVLALCVPSPFGWVSALSTPGLGHTPAAPVTILGRLLPGTEHGWRTAGQVAAVVIVALLLLTSRRRDVVLTAGWGLLAVGLLGPVLYPWYLAPPAVVLALGSSPAGNGLAVTASVGGPWLALPRLG
ncbi:MAG TPA: polyprenol phosphomannose-dependent alpha 1,6 mannosyltransferase MptB [Mycobacteriales bacterium]|nr:polyprenol phosphomannose-dependent alpha 1,6 mannosyltransferase MptB [Mycobacteriales bacterium]